MERVATAGGKEGSEQRLGEVGHPGREAAPDSGEVAGMPLL